MIREGSKYLEGFQLFSPPMFKRSSVIRSLDGRLEHEVCVSPALCVWSPSMCFKRVIGLQGVRVWD